jgi:hypothetical protein
VNCILVKVGTVIMTYSTFHSCLLLRSDDPIHNHHQFFTANNATMARDSLLHKDLFLKYAGLA